MTEAAGGRGHGEGGNVAVPGEVIGIRVGVRGVGVDLGWEGRRLKLAED